MSNPESLVGASYYEPLAEEEGASPDTLVGDVLDVDPRDEMEDED